MLETGRQNSFFGPADTSTWVGTAGLDLTFSDLSGTTLVSRQLSLIRDVDIFGHLNAQMAKKVDYQRSVDSRRQVVLNSPPYYEGLLVKQDYKIGQALWSQFPKYLDTEGNLPVRLVSFDYKDGANDVLPPAAEFFSVIADLDPGEIRSKAFTEDHVGTHYLDVTVADTAGSQTSFTVEFTVTSEVATWSEVVAFVN